MLRSLVGAAGNTNSQKQGSAIGAVLSRFRRGAEAVTRHAAISEDAGLTAELAAVAKAVRDMAGMERAGIVGDYAARIRYAHRHLAKHQVAGMVQALKNEQRAALAALERKVAQELKGRLAAVRRRRRQARQAGPSPE